MSLTLDFIPSMIYEPDAHDLSLSPAITGNSRLWRGFKVAILFIGDTTLRVAIFVAVGVAAHFFYPLLAPPFFAIAMTTFASRTVVRIIDACNFKILLKFKETVSNFAQRFAKLQLISFIFSVAICFLLQIAGIVIAGALGIVNGFIMGSDTSKQTQQRQENGADDPPIKDTAVSVS